MGPRRFRRWLLPFVSALLCTLVIAPAPALALDTVKCTARPNGDTGSAVMGGSVTRITWEGRAAADEAVVALSFTFPEGATFGTEGSRITMLSGADLMERTVIDAALTADDSTFEARFAEAAPAGAYFRVEIYDVTFPVSGGEMQLAGTCELAGGTTRPIEGIPPIMVESVSLTDQWAKALNEQDWVQAWNSNKFLFLFFNPALIVTSFPVVFKGFLMAVGIVACAFPLAIPVGFVLSLMRMARFRVLRAIASVYVNVVRGTPLFLQIYIAFFGLPLAGVQIPSFPLGVIVLAMNSAAYLCEIFRAGIQSIPAGQTEAARSLGMNGAQTMTYVIIPQTVLRVIPTMTSEFILLYKDTSMLAAVGVMEVVMYAKTIVASTGSITPYIVAAIFYLIITLPLAKLVGMLERRLSGKGGARGKRTHKGKPAAPLALNTADSPSLDGLSGEVLSPEFGATSTKAD